MNERIKLLAEQARKYAWENETHWSADAERATLFEQKFAELIVQECVEVVKWTPSIFPNDEYVKNIKQHFGVET